MQIFVCLFYRGEDVIWTIIHMTDSVELGVPIKMYACDVVQLHLSLITLGFEISCFGQVGLQVMLDNGHIFECHRSIADAVYNAEVGASLAIFRAGYSIDSLMLRYQGVDWTNRRSWDCNARCG